MERYTGQLDSRSVLDSRLSLNKEMWTGVFEVVTVECDRKEGFSGNVRRPIMDFHVVPTSL
jgi:hypothetical protein